MKIKSVEVPPHSHHHEDGTSSTYSIEEPPPPVDYERTVASLTQALNELHTELRDRTTENEALLATASSLSESLQQSDRLLQEKSLECERLYLKLQMVTFVERNEDSCRSFLLHDHDLAESNDSVRFSADFELKEDDASVESGKDDAASVPSISSSSSSSKHSSSKKKRPKDRSQETKDKKPCSKSRIPLSLSGPVSVDDFDEASPEIGPRQAHFYNVMLERDRALNAAKKLKKELKDSKQKVKELEGKLDRSNLLVEISYHHEEQQKKKKKKQQQEQPMSQQGVPEETPSSPPKVTEVDNSTEAPDKALPKRMLTRKWLRKNGVSARKSKDDSTFATLVTDEEKLSSKWNNSFRSSKNEAAYLDAIAGNDADRAGGHDSIRFQL